MTLKEWTEWVPLPASCNINKKSWKMLPFICFKRNCFGLLTVHLRCGQELMEEKQINGVNFGFLPIHRCVLALYTQYFPESCEKISQACYSGGIRTHDPCNSRAVSYQLDYRGCPVARGSLKKKKKKMVIRLESGFFGNVLIILKMQYYIGPNLVHLAVFLGQR